MTINYLLHNLFIVLIAGSVVFYGIASVLAPPASWLLGRAGALSVYAADAAEGQLTLYVNGAVATSGDGRTPEQAFKTIGEAIASARRWRYDPSRSRQLPRVVHPAGRGPPTRGWL